MEYFALHESIGYVHDLLKKVHELTAKLDAHIFLLFHFQSHRVHVCRFVPINSHSECMLCVIQLAIAVAMHCVVDVEVYVKFSMRFSNRTKKLCVQE